MSAAPARKPGLLVLVAISALQPFALNALAPAAPSLARALGTSYSAIQLTLSLYLVTVALAQLVIGPLSDRYGRRPSVLIAMGCFLAGSLTGVVASDLATLLAARALQAAGAGTAFALVRAIIRDTSAPNEAASQIGYVTMVMVVVPMVAPLIGAWLDSRLGWQAIFMAMSGFAAISLALALWRLKETAPFTETAHSLFGILSAAPQLLRERSFRTGIWALAATTGSFFAFIAAAPYVVVDVMGHPPEIYGWWFVTNALGYMLGNFVTGRFGQRLGAARLIRTGLRISIVGIGFAAIMPFTPWWTPATLFLPMILNAIGNGLTIPAATAEGLSARPDIAGSAAGLLGAFQLGVGALSALALGWLVPLWPPALTTAMFLSTGAALIALRTIGFKKNY